MIDALSRYKREHGDCNVPGAWPEDRQLGIWVKSLRLRRRQNTLTPSQVKQLDRLGFVWNFRGDAWEKKCAELVKYKKRHGDCQVSTLSPTHAALGLWVRNQRNLHRRGKLSEEHRRRLDQLGFVWDVQQQHWDEMVAP